MSPTHTPYSAPHTSRVRYNSPDYGNWHQRWVGASGRVIQNTNHKSKTTDTAQENCFVMPKSIPHVPAIKVGRAGHTRVPSESRFGRGRQELHFQIGRGEAAAAAGHYACEDATFGCT